MTDRWERSPLVDVCLYITSGGTPSRKKDEFFTKDGGHLWVKSKELGDGYISETEEHITDQGLNGSSAKYIPERSVLLAMYGATVGKVGYLLVPATVNQAVCALVPNPEIMDSRYLFHLLKVVRPALISQAHGAAQQNLNQALIKNYEVAVPPLDAQRQIASILNAFDDLIANSTRRIEILEVMARAIYQEWFVQFRYPGHEGVPLVESELGPVPDGWEVVNAEEAIDFNPKLRLPKEGEKTYLSMASLVENSMVINNPGKRDGNSGTKFQNGDTLFARITPSLENGKTGYVQHLVEDEIAFGSTEFIVLRSLTLSPEFVYCFARRDDFRGTAINSMVGASGRQRVQEASVRSFMLPHPPEVLIETFSARVAQMFELVKTLVTQNDRLATTRDLLLPRLVSGAIDVSHLDLGEVA